MDSRFTALVRGPSVLFPRGFLWVIPVWYAGIALLLDTYGKTPSWYTPVALAGLLVAAVSLLVVLATMRNNAFVADSQAIWLGLTAGAARRFGRRRKQVRPVPWSQVGQLMIKSRLHGAQVDILLGPAAPVIPRPNILRRIAVAILLLIIPISCTACSPGLLSARRKPPGYRVRLYDVKPAELRQALAALAPGTVPIAVVRRARLTVRRPTMPRLPQVSARAASGGQGAGS